MNMQVVSPATNVNARSIASIPNALDPCLWETVQVF
jgi:hypothetical protein